jgi:hypothetical protein
MLALFHSFAHRPNHPMLLSNGVIGCLVEVLTEKIDLEALTNTHANSPWSTPT